MTGGLLMAALAARDQAGIVTALRDLTDGGETGLFDAVRPHLLGLTLTLETAAQLGKALMSLSPRLGPPLAVRPTSVARSITVMGTSHVRFFGGHPLFLPLFIGMGPHTLCLTPESHAVARRKILDNLARVDRDSDLILDLGAEPFYHVQNVLQTRPGNEPTVTDKDLDFMTATAERYEMLLGEVRDRLRGRLIFFNVLPTHNRIGNALSCVLNDRARTICGRLGIGFLDIWSTLLDQATGGLRHDLAAKAYNDDTHLSESAIPIVLEALRGLGVIGDDTVVDTGSAWHHVYGFPVSAGGDTRVWCEADVIPLNAFRSEKVAASFIEGAALDVLLPIIAAHADARVLMLNVKDGFLPISLPPGAAAQVIGVCDNPRALHAAERVAAFAGRDDIALVADRDVLPLRLTGRSFDVSIGNVHPATVAHDLERAEALLSGVSAGRLFVIGPGDLFRGRQVAPIFQTTRFYPLGNRHLPDNWRGYGLFLS